MDLRSIAQNHMTFISRGNEAMMRGDVATAILNSDKASKCVIQFAELTEQTIAQARAEIKNLNQGGKHAKQ